MDQTPVYFSMHQKRTLELVRVPSVNIRKSMDDTRRATFSMCVTASRKTLKPYLIFKGKPRGRIYKKELPTFNKEMFYATQANADRYTNYVGVGQQRLETLCG